MYSDGFVGDDISKSIFFFFCTGCVLTILKIYSWKNNIGLYNSFVRVSEKDKILKKGWKRCLTPESHNVVVLSPCLFKILCSRCIDKSAKAVTILISFSLLEICLQIIFHCCHTEYSLHWSICKRCRLRQICATIWGITLSFSVETLYVRSLARGSWNFP